MDLLFCSKRNLVKFMRFLVWLCVVLLGSSFTASQSTDLKWLTQPTPKTVEAGSSVSFTCSANYSEKIQLYEWEYNNLSLPANDDPRYTLRNDGQTLEISQTSLEDRGDYRCVATREGRVLGRSQNAVLNVKVYVSPAFDVRPKNTTAIVNDNLWLHCNATGDPKPKICWGRYERIGQRLDRSRFIPHHNGTLRIKRVRLDDQDSYFCLAVNRAGMKVSMFSLVVKESKDEEPLE